MIGYRHVRLRNLQNQPLQLSTLFVYCVLEEEILEMVHHSTSVTDGPAVGLATIYSGRDSLESCKEGKEVWVLLFDKIETECDIVWYNKKYCKRRTISFLLLLTGSEFKWMQFEKKNVFPENLWRCT